MKKLKSHHVQEFQIILRVFTDPTTESYPKRGITTAGMKRILKDAINNRVSECIDRIEFEHVADVNIADVSEDE